MSRTTLADRLGCSASTLSALLNNKGPHADTPTALDWAMRIIDACGGAKRDLGYWGEYHSEVIAYRVGVRTQLPTPPQPGAPPALRRWPELAGMTHGALAEGLGLSPSYVDELPSPPEPGEKRFDPSEPPADEVKLRRLSERVDAELIRDLYKALTELHHMKWRPQAPTANSGSTAWLEWLDDRREHIKRIEILIDQFPTDKEANILINHRLRETIKFIELCGNKTVRKQFSVNELTARRDLISDALLMLNLYQRGASIAGDTRVAQEWRIIDKIFTERLPSMSPMNPTLRAIAAAYYKDPTVMEKVLRLEWANGNRGERGPRTAPGRR